MTKINTIKITTTGITTIGIDADDTLWHNEDGFHKVEQTFVDVVSPHLAAGVANSPTDVLNALADQERQNVKVFGYGVKSFMFSMVETAVALTDGRIPAQRLTILIDAGRNLLTRPVELFEGIDKTLTHLAKEFQLVLITKGDQHHQSAKVTESGLAHHFRSIEVVQEKDVRTYERIMAKHETDPHRFLMIGNSVKSDVLPVLEAGGAAIHIPYSVTWALEHAEVEPHHIESGRFHKLESLHLVPGHLAQLEHLIQLAHLAQLPQNTTT